ncbi:YIP1 family protein [Shimia sp.]|uniref:YIP1 family protein n=1 Tax=Shimia sp. TaxID=1954381 RepID=UPI003298F076
MSVTRDMLATYRGPQKVVARLLSMGEREDRALAILMAACAVVFVAQWPRLAREAHMTGQELNALLGGALLAWMFIAPLLFYALAFLSHLLLRVIRRNQSSFGTRMALFWAMLAASPLILLHGLVAGFIGPGPGLSGVGLIWLVMFLWFWLSGLLQAGKEPA